MPTTKNVAIISSTALDLPDHRKQVVDACHRCTCDHVWMETLPASHDDAVKASIKLVSQADIYIGVFGHRYGYVPPGSDISITEIEYEEALKKGLPCLIFFIHDEHVLTIGMVETEDGAKKLKELKKRIGERHVVAFFKSPEDLRGHVLHALPETLKNLQTPEAAAAVPSLHFVHPIPKPPEPYIAHYYALLQTGKIIGRRPELDRLTYWITKTSNPMMHVIAIGGMGKSALTWHWFHHIAPQEWPQMKGRIWWSFYESDGHFENFVTRSLAYVSGQTEAEVRKQNLRDRCDSLIQILHKEPYLIVLDGLERILTAYARMDAPYLRDDDLDEKTHNAIYDSQGKPQGFYRAAVSKHALRLAADPNAGRLLKQLAGLEKSHILTTSRLFPADLQFPNGKAIAGVESHFLEGLSDTDALELWREYGCTGSSEKMLPIFTSFGSHPLVLKAFAGRVAGHRPAPGDFDAWHSVNTDFKPYGDLVQVQSHILQHALLGLSDGERRTLNLIAGFRMPTGIDTLQALLITDDSKSLKNEELGDDEVKKKNSVTYERFTDRARKVMQLANQEAQRFNHDSIGTEHILLGLVKEGTGVAANVLKNLNIDLRKIRLEVEKRVQPGSDPVPMGKLPQTPRGKKVIECTFAEALRIQLNYVGTECLLLGLLREQEGVAAQVLLSLGLKLEDAREEVLNLMGLNTKPTLKLLSSFYELDAMLTLLEDRGLLGWDRVANRYDLHPIVRGVVWDLLKRHHRHAVCETLCDHFEAIPMKDGKLVESLDDVAPALELYDKLVLLGRFDDAFKVFRDHLEYAMLYRLGTALVCIGLLELLFPDGIGKAPRLATSDRSSALNALAQAYQFGGNPANAAQLFARKVGLDRAAKKKARLAEGLCNLSDSLRLAGRLRDAEAAASESIRVCAGFHSSIQKGVGLFRLGQTRVLRGDISTGRPALRYALAIFREAKDEQSEGVVEALLAETEIWAGHGDASRAHLQRAKEMATAKGFPGDYIRIARMEGAMRFQLGSLTSAAEVLQDALTLLRGCDLVEEQVPTLIAFAELDLRRDNPVKACDHLEEVWDYCQRGPYQVFHADALNVLAHIERDADHKQDAIAAATQAYQKAWCDGPPFAYHWGLEAAKKHLAELGAPCPDMPAFDESKYPPLPEVEINPRDEYHVEPESEPEA